MKTVTDLGEIKKLARMFVHLDIQSTEYSPLIVKHPFTDSGMIAYRTDDGGIAQADIVDPRVADILGMHWLALVIVIMGAITCITTLSGFWLAASRTMFGAAVQRQVPQKLALINRYGQPWVANTLVFICSLYFCIMAPEAWINYLFTITVGAAGIIYLQ